MRPEIAIEIGSWPSAADIQSKTGDLALAAKSVFDRWDQDANGFDEVLGVGGICQDIADAMVGVLSDAGVEHALSFYSSVGENHVFVVALLEDGVFTIDIPPHVYETGSGYVWRKREDAVFSEDVVAINRIGDRMDPDGFYANYSD